MKTLVICPLKAELKALKAALEKRGVSFNIEDTKLGPSYAYESTHFVVGGMGEQKFSSQLARWLEIYPETENVICVGTAGALVENLNAGDLVFCTDEASWGEPFEKFLSTFKLHRGLLAYSAVPVLKATDSKALQRATQALAVCMEPKPSDKILKGRRYAEIRAVSDFADENSIRDFNTQLEIALNNAEEFLFYLLDGQKV